MRRSKKLDLAIGISLGLALGVALIYLIVVVLASGGRDSSTISTSQSEAPQAPAKRPESGGSTSGPSQRPR